MVLVYFLTPGRMKNIVLLFGSLVFYGWGEPKYLPVMAAVILGPIKIAHKNTSVRTVCAGTEGVIHGAYSFGSFFPAHRNDALTAWHGSRQIYTNRAIVRSMTSLNSGLLIWAFMPESRHFFTSSA